METSRDGVDRSAPRLLVRPARNELSVSCTTNGYVVSYFFRYTMFLRCKAICCARCICASWFSSTRFALHVALLPLWRTRCRPLRVALRFTVWPRLLWNRKVVGKRDALSLAKRVHFACGGERSGEGAEVVRFTLDSLSRYPLRARFVPIHTFILAPFHCLLSFRDHSQRFSPSRNDYYGRNRVRSRRDFK